MKNHKSNNGHILEEDIILTLRKIGVMNDKQEKKYHLLRGELGPGPQSVPICLDNAGVKIDDYLLAQKIIRGEARMPKAPKKKTSRTPISEVIYDNYRVIRHWVKHIARHPREHLKVIGLGAVLGTYGLYATVQTFNEGLSESEIHKAIYHEIDEGNWTSEKNREQHIKNLEARLSSIKECADLGDREGANQNENLLKDYVSVVREKDPSYAPILDKKLEELGIKYKLK